jgi:hypothetical protein
MSNKPETASPYQAREPIRVRVLRFREPMDAPGLSVASSCTAQDPSNGKRHGILYLPWLRHFELTFHPGGGEKPRVSFVHESMVRSWEPAE